MANHERIHLNLKASRVKNYTGGVAADDIPDEMIHRIQSFMNARFAARTTVLFKSWRLAWLTRPDLDFRDQDFSRSTEFWEFALNTLQRYKDSKLRIYSFRLDMETVGDHQLAKIMIITAIELGATNLTLRIRRWGLDSLFNLPDAVLHSETLTVLSAHECLIDLQYGKKEVSWSNLKTLSLSHVVTYGDLFLDLILKCPSLEEITLDTTRIVWFLREPRRLTPSCDSMIQLHKLKSLQLIGLNNRQPITRAHYPIQLDEFKTSSKREWESDIQIHCDPKLVIVDARFMGEVDLAATFQQVSANLSARSRNPPHFQLR
ncbi:hypothetical protein SASPL_152990 [Salvia splendens]|uniref:F-box/LRR-repeat protein 15/At3g58940/PEG3-like LRR domain-containing protein n=1 Tax=Salvia splendens TaxID=180675 RepID=A0A8X8W4Y2_SALSN|nr:hypothetical protein SASPL_152990 [Salvia splendens]